MQGGMVRRGKERKSRNEVEEISRERKAGREGIGGKEQSREETREWRAKGRGWEG